MCGARPLRQSQWQDFLHALRRKLAQQADGLGRFPRGSRLQGLDQPLRRVLSQPAHHVAKQFAIFAESAMSEPVRRIMQRRFGHQPQNLRHPVRDVAAPQRFDAASWLSRTNAALINVCNSGSRSIASWLPSRRIASINALPSPLPYNSPRSDSPIAVVRRASGASNPTHDAYFMRISFTVLSSPRRNMSSRNARTLRGGTHHASSDVSTSFLFSSGTCSQNS